MVRNRRLPSHTRSQQRFADAPQASIQRSTFDRSHSYKTTFNAGGLIPVLLDEILPGDTFDCKASFFGRLATPITPIMDNLFLDSFFFFVPSRLLWDNFQKFNGEQINPGDSTDFLVPQIEVGESSPNAPFQMGSVGDYFGLPTNVSNISVNALPFRALNFVWNYWFRDENIQDSLPFHTDDGPDDAADYTIPFRGKRKDYFTSCLPWPQKGPAVTLPLGISAPVELDATTIGTTGQIRQAANHNLGISGPAFNTSGVFRAGSSPVDYDAVYDPNGTLVADLSDATAATINDIRRAFQVQRLLERDARGGTRYKEILKSHFGVTSADQRLDWPEYLGGSSSPVLISPIPQTSSTDAESPQGNLAAYGTFQWKGRAFSHSFVEHGYILGLISVRADITYQQGIERMFSRRSRFDFYWPALAHLGEQAVLNKEIYAQGLPADDDVFGYQERYAEYRYKPSRITGHFRSSAADSLDIWHLSQNFASLPSLTPSFIEENPPIDRIKAVTDFPDFILDSYFKLRCTRPMPVYSVPGLIDHH